MEDRSVTRREFVRNAALTAAGVAVSAAVSEETGLGQSQQARIPSFNKDMEYRRLGKTGMMVSAVCLGGHWKRINLSGDEFDSNRHDVISRCIEVGINYVDACVGSEILAYAKALRGRREKMYFGFSWCERELRFPEWRTADALYRGFDQGLKEAGLDYVDLWRLTALEPGGEHKDSDVEAMVEAFEKVHKQGKARFLGVSSHDRDWLKRVIEKWPQISVVLTPYTASSKVKPTDSLFDAVKKQNVGVFGIKPFASGSLFKDGAGAGGTYTDRDDELARLALRYILSNDAISAPIPGLISIHQVDNAARAIRERRELDAKETAHLSAAAKEMMANLPPDYHWLRNWEWV
jgi:aryl-alcohol dehydrogenase-like predicted oxidoreductase